MNNLFQLLQMDCVDLSSLPAHLPSSQPCPYLYPWEVYKSLQTIKLSTAGEPDNITARFINHFAFELASPLAHILNKKFNRDQCPTRGNELL